MSLKPVLYTLVSDFFSNSTVVSIVFSIIPSIPYSTTLHLFEVGSGSALWAAGNMEPLDMLLRDITPIMEN